MSTPDDNERRDARAAFGGKRLALAVYGTFASAFVLVSTWQIVVGVFGLGAAPLEAHAALAAHGCADDVRALRSALDRAFASAVSATDAVSAHATYAKSLAPEWDGEGAAAERCGREPHGAEAFAALRRLRRAQEAALKRQVAEMAPIRRDLGAYVP